MQSRSMGITWPAYFGTYMHSKYCMLYFLLSAVSEWVVGWHQASDRWLQWIPSGHWELDTCYQKLTTTRIEGCKNGQVDITAVRIYQNQIWPSWSRGGSGDLPKLGRFWRDGFCVKWLHIGFWENIKEGEDSASLCCKLSVWCSSPASQLMYYCIRLVM